MLEQRELIKSLKHRLLQYMAGGDLGRALDRDMEEHGDGEERRLGWYACGKTVLHNVASGLAYLHSRRVGLVALGMKHTCYPGQETLLSCDLEVC